MSTWSVDVGRDSGEEERYSAPVLEVGDPPAEDLDDVGKESVDGSEPVDEVDSDPLSPELTSSGCICRGLGAGR